jgi:hypothetical protein
MQSVATRVVVICLLSSAVFGAAGAHSTKTVSATIPRIFEVAAIAYRDYDSQLKSEERSRGSPESESQKWNSDIGNYNVELTEGSDRVHVDFSLRPFKGDLSEGGGRQYVLNETTGEILEHTRDK